MPSKKPCGTRLSEGKSVTSVVVSPDTYAPLLLSAYGELLRHSAVSSTDVYKRQEFRQSFFGKHLDKALTDLPIIKTGKNNDLSLKQNFGGRASCGSFFASADIDSPEGNSIQLAGQFI